jgi:hypothetical protein
MSQPAFRALPVSTDVPFVRTFVIVQRQCRIICTLLSAYACGQAARADWFNYVDAYRDIMNRIDSNKIL